MRGQKECRVAVFGVIGWVYCVFVCAMILFCLTVVVAVGHSNRRLAMIPAFCEITCTINPNTHALRCSTRPRLQFPSPTPR